METPRRGSRRAPRFRVLVIVAATEAESLRFSTEASPFLRAIGYTTLFHGRRISDVVGIHGQDFVRVGAWHRNADCGRTAEEMRQLGNREICAVCLCSAMTPYHPFGCRIIDWSMGIRQDGFAFRVAAEAINAGSIVIERDQNIIRETEARTLQNIAETFGLRQADLETLHP